MILPTYFNIGVACTDAHLDTPTADRVAMIVEDEALGVAQLTYRELAELTSRFAQALRELGVDAGERVLMRLPNHIAYPVVFLGAIKRGAIPVPTSILLTVEELSWLLDDSGAAVLVTDEASWARMGDPLCRACGLRHVILVGRRDSSGADALRMTGQRNWPVMLRSAEASPALGPAEASPGIHIHDLTALLAAIDPCAPPHPRRRPGLPRLYLRHQRLP